MEINKVETKLLDFIASANIDPDIIVDTYGCTVSQQIAMSIYNKAPKKTIEILNNIIDGILPTYIKVLEKEEKEEKAKARRKKETQKTTKPRRKSLQKK